MFHFYPVRRRYLQIGLLAAAAAFFVLWAGWRWHADWLALDPVSVVLPADGRLHPAFDVHLRSGRKLSVAEVRGAGSGLLLLQDGGTVKGIVQAPVMPGTARYGLMWKDKPVLFTAQFAASDADSFGDGTPDFLRLHTEQDRAAFRGWFAGLVETQAERSPEQLPAEIDDCAALLRYGYREALRAHDARWIEDGHFQALAGLPSVGQYKYPQTPLGVALFRVRPGPFVVQDLADGGFAQFADAKSLMQWNTYFVSRDIHGARKGDLIFYRQLEQNSPYHSMVVTGEGAEWVVYHTGPVGKAKGEMRRVAMGDLLHHPDTRWRPVAENSNFLGVYRWNILREGN